MSLHILYLSLFQEILISGEFGGMTNYLEVQFGLLGIGAGGMKN